jgi:hypothetical protein
MTGGQATLTVLAHCDLCPCAWQEVDIEVYRHLGSLTATPLDVVFSWISSAFASHLVPSETLLLWDRVIGFDSLLPLPVLAVAVLTFRWVSPTRLSAVNQLVPMSACVLAHVAAQSYSYTYTSHRGRP